MKKNKKNSLKAAGWKVSSAADFLELTPEEESLIEIRLALAAFLKQRRLRKKITQLELAKAISSSQSRVAKMEAGDPSVSIDLLLRSLLSLGASPKQLARIIATAS